MEVKKKKGKEVREMYVLGVVMLCVREILGRSRCKQKSEKHKCKHKHQMMMRSVTQQNCQTKKQKTIHKTHANKRKQENEMKRCGKTGEERWRAHCAEERDGN